MILPRLFLLLLLSGALFAAASAQELIKTAPPDPKAEARNAEVLQMLREANDMLADKNTDGALAKINAALQADPRSIDAYVLRGAIYNQKKMWDKAENDYESAHLIDPHNAIVAYDLAEVLFVQKKYEEARPRFLSLETAPSPNLSDLATYKVFLCDLLAHHEDAAAQELAAFNQVGQNPSYYFANIAWDVNHNKMADARNWLDSATSIYSPKKSGFYASCLFDLGYLPLPAEH